VQRPYESANDDDHVIMTMPITLMLMLTFLLRLLLLLLLMMMILMLMLMLPLLTLLQERALLSGYRALKETWFYLLHSQGVSHQNTLEVITRVRYSPHRLVCETKSIDYS
jgi:hypothetical protein